LTECLGGSVTKLPHRKGWREIDVSRQTLDLTRRVLNQQGGHA
jgi:hypothetical protein